MDAKTFYRRRGRETCERVAARSGTSFNYFMQIVCGYRRPSPELALKFVKHSDGEMDFESLLRSKRRAA